MKIKDEELAETLHFALRLTEISRWGIVAMGRQQSVGEHSYRVCIIALALYDYMMGPDSRSNERQDIAAFAMTHDIMEEMTGDIQSMFKIALEAQFPGAFEKVTAEISKARGVQTSQLLSSIEAIERGAKNTIVAKVVSLADSIEALIYLDTYGINQHHRRKVRDEILVVLWSKWREYNDQDTSPRQHWARAMEFIDTVLNQPGLKSNVVSEGQHP